MTLVTLTVIALGRIHVSSAPAAAIETLCFNYTVGFFKSVAVLNRPRYSRYARNDAVVALYTGEPAENVSTVSIPTRLYGRSEPLFIPKLQSQFADFPWTRYLLTKGFSPWRPDAVISTVRNLAVAAVFHGRRSPARPELPRSISLWPPYLELNSSTATLVLDGYDNPAVQTPPLKLDVALPLSITPAGILACFPFARYVGRRLELRSESPADYFSGCGILLLVGGLYAG